MAKTLGGSLFIRNGCKYDYPFIEAIRSLLEFCEKVVVCMVPTDDLTCWNIRQEFDNDKRVYIRAIENKHWDNMEFQAKHRISIFTNYAIEMLDTDYVFNLQADEIVDPGSYKFIRRAVEGGAEGYLCSRINLWGSPYTQLNVPHNKKPCSTEIVRLTKTCYRAYDDAESIAAPVDSQFVDQIKIWHMGFVRSRKVHVEKIRSMQADIFKMVPDSKLEGMGDFDPWKWFDKSDVIPIQEPLPALIQQWASERHYPEND